MADGSAVSYSALVDLNDFSDFTITFKRSGETDADVQLADMTVATNTAGSAYVHHSNSGDDVADITGIYAPWSSYKSVAPGYEYAIQIETNSKSWVNPTINVSFDKTTGKYSFTASPVGGGHTFGINFNGAENANFFGFSSTTMTGASSYTSNCVADYCIVPAYDARSNFSREYEPGGISSLAVSDSGQVKKGIVRASVPLYMDWQQVFEPKVGVFTEDATSTMLFTWQQFWEYCRQTFPFIINNTSSGKYELHSLRETSSNFNPEPMEIDNHENWHLNFETHFIGRV